MVQFVVIRCCLSLVDLSAAAALRCNQRYKVLTKWCDFISIIVHFNNLFLHRLCKSYCIWPSSG